MDGSFWRFKARMVTVIVPLLCPRPLPNDLCPSRRIPPSQRAILLHKRDGNLHEGHTGLDRRNLTFSVTYRLTALKDENRVHAKRCRRPRIRRPSAWHTGRLLEISTCGCSSRRPCLANRSSIRNTLTSSLCRTAAW